MTWIKICGTTTLKDAQTASDAGADALGFVFYESSRRKIDPEAACEIVAKLPASVEKVGVFVDESPERITEIVEKVGLTGIQLHGKFGSAAQNDDLVAVKAHHSKEKLILVREAVDLLDDACVSEDARKVIFAVLVDSGSGSKPGGTGKTFDWSKARGVIQSLSLMIPVIVAGGLTPANVGEAMNLFQPFGVDVASGVEAEPGKKDPGKVRAFVQAVRQAEKRV